MQKSQDHSNPATSTLGAIVLYDNAFENKQNLPRILGHELAHERFRNMSKEEIGSFRTATNWFSPDPGGEGPHWFRRSKHAFVEIDGVTSPVEDFANNVEFYLFNRDSLRKITPNADSWIERHFGSSFKLRKEH